MKVKYIVIAILILTSNLFAGKSFAQNFNNDLTERIYIHTDKPLYFPGETIWFKAYLVSATNEISNISEYIHVNLISPKGDVAKTLKLKITQGCTFGDFTISQDMPGGMYNIEAYSIWMKNFDQQIRFKRKLIVQKIVKPKLLLKLKFEKEAYGKSSEVIAKFEVKDLSNAPLINQEIEYILNIAGAKYTSNKIFTDKKGETKIVFRLPGELNTSDVLLNVLVPHNGNIESISRSVPVILDNIDLQFLPEGGYLLSGSENKLAFKALNEFGKPADITAEIIDSEGSIVSRTESFHDGMGVLNFTPQKGKNYFARIVKPFVSDKKHEIPKAKQKGFVFSLAKNDSSEVKFNIYSQRTTSVKIVAKSSHKKITSKNIGLKKGWNEVIFNTKLFPIGIVEFTLINERQVPELERLVFINKCSDLNISIKTDKEQYLPREKVEVELTTTNNAGTAIPSNLSVAVVDDKILSFADDKQDNILSYLLMSSYLKGIVEKPNFYFDPKEEKAEKALDLVMLTNGWRSYFDIDTNESLSEQFKAEKNTTLSRVVTDRKKQPVKATVLILEQNNTRKAIRIETDEDGFFEFKILPGTSYVILAYNDANDQLSLSANLSQIYKKKQQESFKKETSLNITSKQKEYKLADRQSQNNPKRVSVKTGNQGLKTTLSEDSQALDEVVCVGYGVSTKRNYTAAISSVKSEEILLTENPVYALQGRVAGVSIKNDYAGNTDKIMIRGTGSLSANNAPLYIIDGVAFDPLSGNEIGDILSPENINSIEVIKDNSAAAIYGSRASNGVIFINTTGDYWGYGQKNIKNRKTKKIAYEYVYNWDKQDYNIGRKFYMPQYISKKSIQTRNDFRQTIYWNPIIQTDEKGKAKFSFYNSDAITSYKVITEGIGYNGLPGRNEHNYSIQKPLSIDIKLPAYLSAGDTVMIPMIVSNNTTENVNINIDYQFPDGFKMFSSREDSVCIIAQKGYTQYIKVIPTKEISHSNIEIKVKSADLEDVISKEATVLSPLFPKSLSFSGSESKTFNFSMNEKIARQTLSANFTFYYDIIGDVMNGIESIMREPHGCFEQVSSTAYPNVLAYKYLKESGKLSHDIEKRAMGYIKRGYKKLAAYETKQNGFEWYGGTPPHEVLSAYGVMQFIEMKEIYSGVDDEMIKRTVNWLMSRKNGLGGFKQNRGRYGFSSAPQNVNNAYIVYALSHKGINASIEKEYDATFAEAIKTKDPYRLALLATASFNMDKMEKYNKAIEILISNVSWNQLSHMNVENSITRSYGSSLQIETAAFISLSLMHTNKHFDKVQKCIDFILENRKYGRFGNTQATTMALKALIEYTKIQHQNILQSNTNSIVLNINGHEIKTNGENINDGMLKISNLEKYIASGQQSVEVLFQNNEMKVPYSFDLNWKTQLPESTSACPIELNTEITNSKVKLGETVRMNIELSNKLNKGVPMTTSIIGIPSGCSLQIWQLEELKKQNAFAYYEIINNYLVCYWRELGPNQTKSIKLDLKTEIKGSYTAAASSSYLYYADDYKNWVKGTSICIE